MTVATQREWASVVPYGADDQRTDFTANRIAIERLDGPLSKNGSVLRSTQTVRRSMLLGMLSIEPTSTVMLYGHT